MNRLVSVIVPVFNVEQYLRECIDSIIDQTYPYIEIILVNDGSTDDSYSICNEYKEEDNRIIVVNKENGGLSSARNKGIEFARGDYISFVDSDDYIAPDMIESLVKIMDREQVEVACCNFKKFKKTSFSKNTENDAGKKTEVYESSQAINYLLDEKHYKCFAWNKIYKKDLFREIRFPEGKLYEDIITQYKIFKKAKKVAFNDKAMYYYRIREGSITKKVFDRRNYELLEPIKVIKTENDDNSFLLWGCALYYLYFIDDMIAAGVFDKNIYEEFCDLVDSISQDTDTSALFSEIRKRQILLCKNNLWIYKCIYRFFCVLKRNHT